MSYIHKDVHKITVDGDIAEMDMERHKSELIRTMQDQLRVDGHIPLLDMDPQFSVGYDFERDVRTFTLSVFGIKGDNPWDYSGVLSGRAIKKSTTNPKSPQS